MNDAQFLETLSKSFQAFLTTHSRSNAKLKILHGAIAEHIKKQLGDEYNIQSLGFQDGKEGKIKGRYMDKNVDILIEKEGNPIAGIGVKFIMQNYSQNSNNYFENMLGETANIRANEIAYFQILIIPDKIPYYSSGGKFQKWETFSIHNSQKYRILSNDDSAKYYHTPNKTLLYVVNLPNIDIAINNKQEYCDYYNNLPQININKTAINYGTFNKWVTFNEYEIFINKICYCIKSI